MSDRPAGGRLRPTVVLTMIVRDEAHVLERCLRSVRPLVDTWCIVDTGSTDGTQALARRVMHDLPGLLVERPWVGFAHNRTEALQASRELGDLHFVVDADAELVIDTDDLDALRRQWTADLYGVVEHLGVAANPRPMLLSTRHDFRYRGVIHETVVVPPACRNGGVVRGIHFVGHPDGARSRDPRKYAIEAELLEAALDRNDEPDLAPRYVFHLAQAHRAMGDGHRALDRYRQRVALGGDRQEVYVSLLWCGMLASSLGQPVDHVLSAFLHAIDVVPDRAEAYHYAAVTARLAGRMPTARLFASNGLKAARATPVPFQDRRSLAWGLTLEHALATAALDGGAAATGELERLRTCTDLPDWARALVESIGR